MKIIFQLFLGALLSCFYTISVAQERYSIEDRFSNSLVKLYNENARGQQDINYTPTELLSIIKADTAQINRQIRYALLIPDNKPDSAIQLLKETLIKSEAIGYENGIIRSLRNLAYIYNKQGYYEKSLQCYKVALPYAEKTYNNQGAIAQIYIGIAVFNAHVGKFDSTGYYVYKALDEIGYIKTTNSDVISIYNDVAVFWVIMGDTSKALSYLRKAKDLAITYKDTGNMVMSMISEANIYADNKQWDSAMFYCQKVIVWCKKANNFNLQSQFQWEATLGAGVIYIGMKQPPKAIPWLQEAVRLSMQANDQTDFIKSYYNLGYAYYLMDDYKKAEKIMLRVCLQSQNTGLKDEQIANAHGFLSEIYRQKKNYTKAFSEMETYHQIRDSLLTKEKAQAVNQLDVKYQVAEKDKALTEKQLQLLKQQNKLKEKNFWITGTSVGFLLLAVSLIVLYRSNRHKQHLQNVMINNLHQAQEISQLKARMDGEEKERTRIARELHDGIGGMLASIKMNLNSVKSEHPELSGIKKLNDITFMVHDTAVEVRKTAHNLLPDILVRYNLEEALKLYCDAIGQLYIDLQFSGELNQLNKATELILYRIIQELIQNIVKHSKADKAEIQVVQHESRLAITVEDNGIGFDIKEHNGGFGLQNLHYRVHALQGEISIMSAKGRNTTIFIEFDIEKLKKTTV